MNKETVKIPMGRAILCIFLITLVISGFSWMGWLYYLQRHHRVVHHDKYRVVAIVQSSQSSECLKTVYLAELLNLSINQPINLYEFNLEKSRKRLLASPVIKEAMVKKVQPGTVYVEYEIRTPIAFLADYTNTALDREGILFPFRPFFTPKKIPSIYLGLNHLDMKWGQSIFAHEGMQLAFKVMEALQDTFYSEPITIKRIDVSKAFAESYGQKQIVVQIEEEMTGLKEEKYFSFVKPTYLRLNTDHYVQNIANYSALRKHMGAQENVEGISHIVDMRISHLAFLKKLKQ